ncbi:MAG: carboxymethylenebutenolidase [uncultured bacterium]|nr:MAG: carboxymethylenebutenolidase [uncultured bacterium]
MLKTKAIEYRDGDVLLEGFCAYPQKTENKLPVVLVVHDWSGRNDFANQKAIKLAELGYIGFALDMYGKGKLGKTNEEKSALMQPFVQNRSLLQKRILAAFETAKLLEHADDTKIGAIGFCFGGLCALDLARSGADVKGIVSFHGLLHEPENVAKHTIKAKILALHGYADPMVTSEAAMKFADEMTHANVDWQLHMYGHVMHAFTNPNANDTDFGTVYHKTADARSWIAMCDFFREIF